MAPKHKTQYALDILHAVSRHQEKTNRSPHPVEHGTVTRVGDDDADIRIKLTHSTVVLEGDEVQFLIPEEFLTVGDTVCVVFDESGDPMVVSADFQADPYVTATGPVSSLNPTGLHQHYEKVFVPTAPQTSFPLPNIFTGDGEQVYVNGLRQAKGFGYNVSGRRIVLATPAAASSIVLIDYQVDQ